MISSVIRGRREDVMTPMVMIMMSRSTLKTILTLRLTILVTSAVERARIAMMKTMKTTLIVMSKWQASRKGFKAANSPPVINPVTQTRSKRSQRSQSA